MKPTKSKTWFSHFAKTIARASGRPSAFGLAVGVILAWAVTGPAFHFSDTWQLVINTGTTIVTFLMVFLIQCTQNRDSEAMQVKLDELIRAIKNARNELVDLEELSDEELRKIAEQFRHMRKQAESNDASPSRHSDPVEIAASTR